MAMERAVQARPALVLAQRKARPSAEGDAEASPSAAGAGDEGAPTGEAPPGAQAAGPADAQAVADRVYELMKQEVWLARLRGASASG